MKKNIFKMILLSGVMLLHSGCQEEEFLNEVPLDFYSPENSFITEGNFTAALTDLYARVRAIQSVDGGASLYSEVLGTDLAFNARLDQARIGSYLVAITPQGEIPRQHWIRWYKVISNANTIIFQTANFRTYGCSKKGNRWGSEAFQSFCLPQTRAPFWRSSADN
ncbi:RagB/SusD family nutrient uptake outer membrane protein [Arundinibacter roseus]|uniref:hypothetical protein n=1 Tax=Arundinibacter roseus TaxID=2070510 RepID=UPI001E3EF5CF|nr:hypothetical protein [Arundinibacter roseus]